MRLICEGDRVAQFMISIAYNIEYPIAFKLIKVVKIVFDG